MMEMCTNDINYHYAEHIKEVQTTKHVCNVSIDVLYQWVVMQLECQSAGKVEVNN